MMETDLTSAIEDVLSPKDPDDRRVIANCHPPNYVNPRPSGKYNLIAIGAGTAGLVSSGGAGFLGSKSALIERRLTGGDCLVTGCVPSKALIRAARAVYDLRLTNSFGIHLNSEPLIDFMRVMERMRRLRARISFVDSIEHFSRKYHVDVYLGEARFAGPTSIEVEGSRLEFERAVIATGSRPADLQVPGLKDAGYLTNETIFKLTELPPRLVVIGGGPSGCEIAQSFLRFGSAVTIINDVARILARDDIDAGRIVHNQFEREGMVVINEAKILRVERRGSEKVVIYSHGENEDEAVCDAIFCATGRAPNIEGLGLEAAGVAYSPEGIIVDDHLRTGNRRIYAAGDVCSNYKFTHAADAMARIALRNALFFGWSKVSSLVIPRVTYTDPEVAQTGYNEAGGRAAGYDVATITEHFDKLDRAILDGEEEGMARVHYDRRTGKILGGTIVARHAGEMISELTLAIAQGLKMSALSSTIHPYPTQAEALHKIGDTYSQMRFTTWFQKLFKMWFEWKRS
ncbi:MAG: mercuric reductase [Acidobacteria bacterium]|nr:mercuric reductase [Acidobacteriota bacterium]